MLKPNASKPADTTYRRNLPLREVDALVSSYGGRGCESMCFEYSVNRGYFAMTAIVINALALIIGLVYSIVKRDIASGFTLAASLGVPMALLALIVALWKD